VKKRSARCSHCCSTSSPTHATNPGSAWSRTAATIAESLTTEAILDAFATIGRVLPRDALKQAAERWTDVGPALIALLEAAAGGAEPSERTDNILCFGIYLMAQVRDTRAYRPLCNLAADGGRLEPILVDAITEDLSVILARVYDGDQAPLRTVIESADADEFVRNAAVGTLTVLTAAGRIGRDETAAYLRHLHATMQPQDESYVWVGWQQAVALLCLDDLVPLVEDAFARGLIGDWVMDIKHFHADLSAARQAGDPALVFDSTVRDDGRFDDVSALMAGWACFQPEKPLAPPPRAAARPPSSTGTETVRNPYRGVGRNDPCPCGSGKKFKKCCLDKVK
jgi:hypothetical protein